MGTADKKGIEQRLGESLKLLTVSEPFEKITIKRITDGAGVIRVTFYNHFQDKYDLLAWIIRNEIFEPVRILILNGMYHEAIVLIFSNLLRDRKFYRAAVKIEGQNSFAQITQECICEALKQLFEELLRQNGTSAYHNPEHPWMSLEYLARYYAQSMTFVVLEWLRTGMTIPPEEMAGVYDFITEQSMWDALGTLAGKQPGERGRGRRS